jgi:hypothetical protein
MAEWSNALDLRSSPPLRAQVRILLVLLALLAQLVEHTAFNRRVTGSSPVQGFGPKYDYKRLNKIGNCNYIN